MHFLTLWVWGWARDSALPTGTLKSDFLTPATFILGSVMDGLEIRVLALDVFEFINSDVM